MEEKENLHKGHRERVKEKFLELGFTDSTPDHEVLELILFYSIPRQDTNPIAHRLINKFGSLAGVLNASYEQLIEVEGISAHSATLIKLIPATASAYMRSYESNDSSLVTASNAGDYLVERYQFLGNEEVFSVLSFNAIGQMKSFDIIEKGDIATVGVSVRKIMEVLIRAKAHSVVFAHNHPSGIALPSQEDVTITAKLRDSLLPLGITVSDHIIISGKDYVSLAQSERFKELFK